MKLGPKALTVVIMDTSRFVHMQAPPTYRSVRVELTEEQRRLLSLHNVGSVGGRPMYEEISLCFFEEDNEKNPDPKGGECPTSDD